MPADSNSQQPLPITGDAKPPVPVFACLVYVCHDADGRVSGRVVNLAGADAGPIEASGSSERDVLGQLTREFKARVFALHEAGQAIPWIDPPPPPEENEQTRSIPVHL